MSSLWARLTAGFRKLIHWLNFPRHIRNYYLRKKINKHTGKQETKSFFRQPKVIASLVIGLVLLIGLNLVYKEVWLLISSCFVVGVAAVGILIKETKVQQVEDSCQGITELILKDQEGNNVKRWTINNRTSCLIGKQTDNNHVDIDLSQATYSSLISRQHAVLNNTGDKWYFEDANSYNGSGLRKQDNSQKFKVESGRPYQLNVGDTIYIANTKLVVR